jgi:hypothetical protein
LYLPYHPFDIEDVTLMLLLLLLYLVHSLLHLLLMRLLLRVSAVSACIITESGADFAVWAFVHAVLGVCLCCIRVSRSCLVS